MTTDAWTTWPSREALAREVLMGSRRWLARAVRALVLVAVLWSTFSQRHATGWKAAAVVAGLIAIGFTAWGFFRTTLCHALWPSLGLMVLLMGEAYGLGQGGFRVAATVLWCACVVISIERLPLAVAAPMVLAALTGYASFQGDGWLNVAITGIGLTLGGFVLRLEAESRGTTQRLLVQERAARKAEAESAALAERARIAREIHDVLAHSLSAQLVHLEAARLRIEQEPPGPFRDQILERVVASRSMAREGLAETRQALSALRGEMVPLGDHLRELAALDGAEVEVAGEVRPLRAEASQAVRRVAQEALTNVRKHAPGARVRILLTYGADEVSLEVRDSGARDGAAGALVGAGGGYGLLGMRERAELLGGTLEAGPAGEGPAGERPVGDGAVEDGVDGVVGGDGRSGEKGFSVRLRVPA
ncbi:histidine kinase [Streptomyces sp. NPDC093085]|uniref:sensor histidine kinase n=1 Tax=Streptomyces sp. NPDC093085 TaxID=3155068 RepID=UPI00344209F3